MPRQLDPNSAATGDSGIFGLPYAQAESAVVYLPVPWEVTTSYGGGTAGGPQAILAASRQVDLFDADVLRPYEAGLHLLPESAAIRRRGLAARKRARRIIAVGGSIGKDASLRRALAGVNRASVWLNREVETGTARLLSAGKIVGLVGGDHSTPLGALRAVARRHPRFGLLQIDAHADLRRAYEGFTYSHASVMFNVLEELPQVTRLVQVGVRDFCEEEWDYARAQGRRVRMLLDRDLQAQRHAGRPWARIADAIVASLPPEVWISFDIDGLDPRYCPHTGTPVPGGLDFAEANHLIGAVARSGRRIIGFDLNEVAPDPAGRSEWDANVGARLLYKLTAWTLLSRGLRTPLKT